MILGDAHRFVYAVRSDERSPPSAFGTSDSGHCCSREGVTFEGSGQSLCAPQEDPLREVSVDEVLTDVLEYKPLSRATDAFKRDNEPT